MKIIRLVVFCEEYWNKGLIYTQNLMPLKILADRIGAKLELISFTSALVYLFNHNKIKKFCRELNEIGIDVINYPTLYYPTRYMLTRWFMLPFYNMNMKYYVKHLMKNDVDKEISYNLRSYEVSLAFLEYYDNKNNLFFDTRTDWIEENINAGNIKFGSKTHIFWKDLENKMIQSFNRTIVISDIFKQRLIDRHGANVSEKISVVYNPISYDHFNIPKINHNEIRFLYTGSLGQWNRLENYLDFFQKYHKINRNSSLVICTGTSKNRVSKILDSYPYEDIRENVVVNYNVKYEDLPHYYASCDFGLQLMNKKDSRVGVKFVEYVAAGIVPIVSDNVEGAAFLAKKYNLGIVISGNENSQELSKIIDNWKPLSKEISEYMEFKSLTDINSISHILEAIYYNS